MNAEAIQWFRCEECFGLWYADKMMTVPCVCKKTHEVCIFCEERRRTHNPHATETWQGCPKYKDGRPQEGMR